LNLSIIEKGIFPTTSPRTDKLNNQVLDAIDPNTPLKDLEWDNAARSDAFLQILPSFVSLFVFYLLGSSACKESKLIVKI